MHQSSNLNPSTSEKNSRATKPTNQRVFLLIQRAKTVDRARLKSPSVHVTERTIAPFVGKVCADWTNGRMSESKPPSEEEN